MLMTMMENKVTTPMHHKPTKSKNRYPPPQIYVLPSAGGFIREGDITDNDVLSGRGGGVNGREGNIRYRHLVNSVKTEYLSPQTRKLEKCHIAARVVYSIRKYNGRFLKLDNTTGYWYEIGDKAAFRKTGQALREGAPQLRGSEGEEDRNCDGIDVSGIENGSTTMTQQQKEVTPLKSEEVRDQCAV